MTRWFPLWTTLLIFGGLAGLLFSVSSSPGGDAPSGAASGTRIAIAWAHVATLFIIVVARRISMRIDAGRNEPESTVAKTAWRQYGAGIDALCIHWILLYGLLALAWNQGPAFEESTMGRITMVAIELVNAMGGLIYFFLFFVLDRPTVSTDHEPGRDAHFREAWLAVVGISALAAFGSAMARLDRVPGEAMVEVCQHASPVVVAIGMMYLFSRYDAVSMGIRPLAVAPLWGYVALQATWARASGPEDLVSTGVFALAYVMKLYFLAMQTVWSREGRIQRHLDLGAL